MIQQTELFNVPMGGFRLDRLEVLNWGTFNREVRVMRMDGHPALLTGPNGSGKSTLVDALLTLIVPKKQGRNYNMASGAEKKTERTERSYIRGAWAEESLGDGTSASRQDCLREPGVPTVILAVFKNHAEEATVTLAQVLWDSGSDIHKLHIVTQDDRSIIKDFANLGSTKTIEKTLRTRKMDPTRSFEQYAQAFCRLLHLRFPSSLSLFNQVVSIKETGEISKFIREHMLDYVDVSDPLSKANDQLADLEECDRNIQSTKDQISLLGPIHGAHEKLQNITSELVETRYVLENAKYFFASVGSRLASEEKEKLKTEKGSLEQQQNSLKLEIKDLRVQAASAKTAYENDEQAVYVQQLEVQIKEADERKERVSTARGNYETLLRKADIKETVREESDFFAVRETAKQRLDQRRGENKGLVEKAYIARAGATSLRSKAEQLLAEITDLQGRKSNIRGEPVTIRTLICNAMHMTEGQLPFAGELMAVKPEFTDWRHGLEVLLRQFATSMLVHENDYDRVLRYVQKTDLKGRIHFDLVRERPASSLAGLSVDRGRVMERLDLKPGNPFVGWLADELRQRFTHKCCDTIEEFQKEHYALTREGLVRNGPTRHIKNDRKEARDPLSYCLGWSNDELLSRLKDQVRIAQNEAAKLESDAGRHDANREKVETDQGALTDILRVEKYVEIDTLPHTKRLKDLQTERKKVLSSSESLRRLKKAHEDAEANVESADKQIGKLQTEIGRVGNQVSVMGNRREGYDSISANAPADLDVKIVGQRTRPFIEKKSLDLDSIDAIGRELDNTLTIAVRRKAELETTARNELEKMLRAFLDKFPHLKSDYSPIAGEAQDFLSLKKSLEVERLPEYEARFRTLINESVTSGMTLLRARFDDTVRDYRKAIEALNKTLEAIDYSPGTFIQIVAPDSTARIIAEFRADLKACFANTTVPTDEQRWETFSRIRTLLRRLGAEERWRKFVIDARNWLDFVIDEKPRNSDAKGIRHTASDAKSGGQKAKLAFTVMASAIAHQYGLLKKSAPSKSFRFVVIDEIFGKTDETNSRFALRLFQQFDLQLLVVCPFSAQARVVDGYARSFHLTTNPDRNHSMLMTVSLERLRSERDQALLE